MSEHKPRKHARDRRHQTTTNRGMTAPTRRNRDVRFRQLFALAREGNAEAVADLWREYGFDFIWEEP